jgi:hypothetical protein
MGGAASSQKGSDKVLQPGAAQTEQKTIPASTSKQQLKSVLKKKPISPEPGEAQQEGADKDNATSAAGKAASIKLPARNWQQRTIQMAGRLFMLVTVYMHTTDFDIREGWIAHTTASHTVHTQNCSA